MHLHPAANTPNHISVLSAVVSSPLAVLIPADFVLTIPTASHSPVAPLVLASKKLLADFLRFHIRLLR